MSKETERIIISPELKQRLIAAKENGSIVAEKILEEIKKPRVEIMSSNLANNFCSKRCVSGQNEYKSLVIKVCSSRKDFDNANNPDHGMPEAADRPSNQVQQSPAKFAMEFKNLAFTDTALTYFDSAIKETSKVTIKISNKFKDFERAYNGSNYSIFGDYKAPLHNSCMRYDNISEPAADFYKNFAGARMMIATNKNNEIVGRAIIWDNLEVWRYGSTSELLASGISFLDRKYYAFDFVRTLMLNYAKEQGIDMYKTHDDIQHMREATAFHDINRLDGNGVLFHADTGADCVCFKKDVPQVKWHKFGAPYLDTLPYVIYTNGKVYLCNYDDGVTGCEYRLATCRDTDGTANRSHWHVCPSCGTCHSDDDFDEDDDQTLSLCRECQKSVFKKTPFGPIFTGKSVKRRGLWLPASIAKSPSCDIAINISRLFKSE